jgi:rhomboid family GlyGly-CTERM serine protease
VNYPPQDTVSALRQTTDAWVPVLVLVAASLLLGIGGDAVREWGRYERDGIEAGEIWRLLSGHLVHLGAGHLMLNVAALVAIRLLIAGSLSPAGWAGAMLASVVAIDAGLYFFAAEVRWYVGLSGVLHGLLAAGAIAMLRPYPVIGATLVVGLVVKLGWEQAAGPLPLSEATAGGPVIVAAHLYGALGGGAYALLLRAVRGRTEPSL